jgi:hypothetical protein
MSESRAEYYREYRRRKKVDSGSTESEFVVTALHDVAQQLQQTVQQLAVVVQQLQHVAQQISQQNATEQIGVISFAGKGLDDVREVLDDIVVAQQSQQSVAQHNATEKKSKRKGSFPPSFPPSHPPQTPPYSSPLISPQSPKEKGAKKFSIPSGEQPDFEDDPNSTLLTPGKGQSRDLATFSDLQESAQIVWDETQSISLQNAFFDWIEYKQERGPKEFYTRKGMLAEGKHFVRKHFEDFNVVGAVERAIASNWQGWDHK